MELIIISIAWSLGIIMGLYFSKSIALFLLFLLFVCICLNRYILKNINISKFRICLIIFGVVLIISYLRIIVLEEGFKQKYNDINNEVEIIGTIISEAKKTSYKSTYILSVESIDNDFKYRDTKILFSVKSSKCCVKYGDKIKIYGKLEDANVARNEGGFDYKEYLKQKGIYKTISIKNDSIEILKENNVNLIDRIVFFIKNTIKEESKRILPEKEASFLIGILIGDKLEIDDEIKDNFSNSNLSHILAVSGMHVSYVVMGIGIIINKIKVGKIKAKIITIVSLIFFMILTGCSASVQRACIMSIYMIIGSLLHKKVNSLNSIFFSSIIILIINPYCLFDIGFQLSFLGTFGIVLLYPILKKYIKTKRKDSILSAIKGKVIDISLVTLSSNIFLFPIIMYHFNTISTIFLISNLLASPLIGIIILGGFLCIILSFIMNPIAKIFSIVLKILIDILLYITNVIGNLPFSKLYCSTPKLHLIIIYYLLIIFLIFKKKYKLKIKLNKRIIVIVLIFIILLEFIIPKIIHNNLKIYFVDVGQRRLYINCYT